MKKFLHSRDGASKGAALFIVLGLVVIATALSLAYFTRTTTDRQLAQSSYNDTSSDLLARTALDITVSDLKQEIATNPVDQNHIQPSRYGVPPITAPSPIPNLIRRSVYGVGPTSNINSAPSPSASPRRGEITLARWNSHYLIPRASTGNTIDSTPVSSFTAPDWVLVTGQGPNPAPPAGAVIGRYAFAVYDQGGLMNMNLGGFPGYAGLSRPIRRLAKKYPSEESEIMLAAFTPNDNCQPPNFTPDHTNITVATGVPCSLLFNTNHNPTSFGIDNPPLPPGLSIDTTNGNIYGTPTVPGQKTIIQTCQNECGSATAILNLTIEGLAGPDTTPWPVNLARKGTVAFADLTALPSTPTVITPTTPVGDMDNFLPIDQINKIMGWRNYATTQQPGAFFPNGNPWFPPGPDIPPDPTKDLYARYFLGEKAPFGTPFTAVPATVWGTPPRTDQALMTRQELIRLQRTIGFSQSLLQYLGTFSREYNRPAPSWPPDPAHNRSLTTRWDMNNLAIVLPGLWNYPGYHGIGHAWGKQRLDNGDLERLFNLAWVPGTFAAGTRETDPNYYGHWKYKIATHNVNELPATDDPKPDPDFFQVINYVMKQKNGGVSDPATVFAIGAALIDQYDTDDLNDSSQGTTSNNTITIIDYLNDGNAFAYAYGIENLSFQPNTNPDRPFFAPYPRPGYTLLNRRFENVGEFGYARNPLNTTGSGTLNFASAASLDTAILDFFTYNTAGNRAGIVDLNTRNGPVLASIIRGAWLDDPSYENLPPDSTYLVSQTDALTAAQAIVQETMSTDPGRGPVLTRADVARLAEKAAAAVPTFAGSDEKKQTIARALAEVGQARTWNLMIDVIAQTGNYAPGTTDLTDPTKFIVQGEKRYWLHIALDRDDGTVLGTQLEEVIE